MLQNLWLERLYTEFILHTMLASSSDVNRERLIITAHEIVNTVLLPARRRDLLHRLRADIEWAVSGDIPGTLEINASLGILTTITAGVLRHALCQRSGLGASTTKSTSCRTNEYQSKRDNPRYQRFNIMLRFMDRGWAE